jgi:hypothetical protein
MQKYEKIGLHDLYQEYKANNKGIAGRLLILSYIYNTVIVLCIKRQKGTSRKWSYR